MRGFAAGLVVAVVLGGLAVWWWARRRAEAPPTMPTEAPSDVLNPAPPELRTPVQEWRARVMRAALIYRDAVVAASLTVPHTGWIQATRAANHLVGAASVETRTQLELRAAFLRLPVGASAPRVLDGGPTSVAAVKAAQVAMDAVVSAIRAPEPPMLSASLIPRGALARDVVGLDVGPLEILP